MVRKFGSMEAFERVKKSHGLIPRGKEVGLDEKVGFHQPQLDKRIQSSTMKSHRLILYVAQTFGLESCEALYDEINRRHFTEAAVLNDSNMLMAALSVALNISKEQQVAALSFLNDGQKGYNTVLQMYERVQNLGVYSIPTLVVDGRYMLSGAQKSNQIYDLLVKAIQMGITSKRLFGDFSVLEKEKE